MREIKFRAWVGKKFEYVELPGIGNSGAELLRDTIPSPELQQYTGLHDKNGVEIYEGDILKDGWHKSAIVGPVHFASYGDGEYVDSIQCWMIGEFTPLQDSPGNEVIGNIHENPELLK